MQREIAFCFFVVALSACSARSPGTDSENRECHIDLANWHKDDVTPPNRVLAWHMFADNDNVYLNGKIIGDKLPISIRDSRNHRPSPYVLLSHSSSTDCDRVKHIAVQLNEAIDCSRNYCVYQGVQDEAEQRKRR